MSEVFLCVGRAIGHTCGVKVDGPWTRPFGREGSEGSKGSEGSEGGGGGFAANYKKAGPRPRHFDRSEAEWRNLLPLMVRAALEREIFRLRVSSERFPSALHTDTQPRSR